MERDGFKLDGDMAEFCGIISGDGNIWTNMRKYEVTITGSPKDRSYLDRLAKYVSLRIKSNPYYRQRGRGLRLTIYSVSFFKFLTEEVGFGIGIEKNSRGIPAPILKSRDNCLSFIRGFFDTDGSIFTSKKKGVFDYPTIEITNENVRLLRDIQRILDDEGFRTTFRKSNSNTYKIALHGKYMVKHWASTIGSSHPRKYGRIESIIKTTD